jgi:hypothetical protein
MDQLDLFNLPEPTAKEKEKAAKDKAERKMAKEKADAKQDSADDEFKKKNQQRPMISPGGNVFKGATAKDYTPQETAIARKAENEEFKDKRVKASPLTVSSELAKMKEILSKPKGGGGGSGGGGGGSGMPKTGLNKKPEFKSGGKVSSASKRADGCAIRGKTRA